MRASIDAMDDVCGVCGATVGDDGALLAFDHNGARCGACGSAFFLTPLLVDDDFAELVPRGRMLGADVELDELAPAPLTLRVAAFVCWSLGWLLTALQVLAARAAGFVIGMGHWFDRPTMHRLWVWALERRARNSDGSPPPSDLT